MKTLLPTPSLAARPVCTNTLLDTSLDGLSEYEERQAALAECNEALATMPDAQAVLRWCHRHDWPDTTGPAELIDGVIVINSTYVDEGRLEFRDFQSLRDWAGY